jgi:hypothetical protein
MWAVKMDTTVVVQKVTGVRSVVEVLTSELLSIQPMPTD